MFLTTGNSSHLEGKVLIYAKLYDDNSVEDSVNPKDNPLKKEPLKPEYTGLCASVEDSDIEKLNLPKICPDSVRYNDITVAVEDPVNFFAADFYFAQFRTPYFDMLPLKGWDRMFVGSSFHQSKIRARINRSLDIYLHSYNRQLLKLLPAENNTHKKYAGVFLKSAILDNYIKPLMFAVKKKNHNLIYALSQRFSLFFDQEFHNDVEPLIDVVLNTYLNPEMRNKLINYHLHKLVAVCNEDFEHAAYLKRKLAEISY
jgi:hypothetical protein